MFSPIVVPRWLTILFALIFWASAVHPAVFTLDHGVNVPSEAVRDRFLSTEAPLSTTANREFQTSSLHAQSTFERRVVTRYTPKLDVKPFKQLQDRAPNYAFPAVLSYPGYYPFREWLNLIPSSSIINIAIVSNTAGFYEDDVDLTAHPTTWGYHVVPKTATEMNNIAGSIDHVWERSLLQDFLLSVIGPDFDGDDFEQLFFHTGACSPVDAFLQQIMNMQPSMDPTNFQPGFAAMPQLLNSVKGNMFHNSGQGALFNLQKRYKKKTKPIDDEEAIKALVTMRQITVIFELFNNEMDFRNQHDSANNRIYQAFTGLDNYIQANNVQRAHNRGPISTNFGSAYRAWYTNVLDTVSKQAFNWIAGTLDVFKQNPYSNSLTTVVQAMNSSPKINAAFLSFPSDLLTWDHGTPMVLHRRGQSDINGACSTAGTVSAIASHATTSPSKTSKTSSSVRPFPCTPSGDTEDHYVCVCTNLATISTVPNTNGDICPWSTLPPAAISNPAFAPSTLASAVASATAG